MLKLSNRISYGVRALVDLAMRSEEANGKSVPARPAPVTLSAIAARQSIPQPFLEQIFSCLRRAGLVEAVRGARGGYRLKKDPREISVGDIVTALEGPLGPALCAAPENFSLECHVVDGCFSRLFCQKLDNRIAEALGSTRIADLCQEALRLSASKSRELKGPKPRAEKPAPIPGPLVSS